MLKWWGRFESPVILGELEYKQSPAKTTHYKNVNTLPYSKKFTLAFFSWITSSRYFSAHSISHLQYGDKVLCKNVAQLSRFQRNRHNNPWCPCAMNSCFSKISSMQLSCCYRQLAYSSSCSVLMFPAHITCVYMSVQEKNHRLRRLA